MKKNYYILGCGGFAKEVYFLSKKILVSENYQFKGFIDYEPIITDIEACKNKLPVIDEDYFLNNVLPNDETLIFIGVGEPKLIEKLSIKFANYNFPNLIHNNFIGDINSIDIGKGNIITAGCVFTVDIKIGSFNVFNLNVTVGHDTKILNNNVFNPGCNVSGSVSVGSNNLFGTNSTILQQISIENNNIIGASSLINKNVDNDKIMVGVPAKVLNK
jgi:sugar O-acyltransferase (sialic acid O-acetyltransferase NeuD family)